MNRKITVLALFLSAGSSASVAFGQSWAAPVSGTWFDAAKWNPAVAPTGAGAVATLGLSGSYTVGTPNNTLGALHITNPGAMLAIDAGNGLTLGSATDTLNGVLMVNGSGGYAGTLLSVGTGAVTFTGSGSIRLNASTSDGSTTANTAAIVSGAGGQLIMNAGTRLEGFGILRATSSVNGGTFTANVPGHVLRVEGASHQNNALYTATGGGTLVLNSTSVTQSAAGQIAPADGSAVVLSGATIDGGTIASTATGRVQVTDTTILNHVSLVGGIDQYGSTSTVLQSQGMTLVGGATFTVNLLGSYAGTYFRVAAANTALSGSGTLRLNASTSDGSTTANTAALTNNGDSSASLVVGSGVSLAGFGIVNGLPTVNNGTFSADVDGRYLRVEGASHTNNAQYVATGGGQLLVSNTTLTQAPSASLSATGSGGSTSGVQLMATTIVGGWLVSNGAAHVALNGGTWAALEGVTIAGQMDHWAGSTMFIDAPGITLSGGATVVVNPGASYAGTYMRTGVPVTIAGNGTVRVNASTSDGSTTANTAALMEDGGDAGGAFTFAPGVTLAGFGIVNTVPTTNNGVFSADVAGRPLRLEGSTHQNNNLYASSNGGWVWLAGTTVNQTPSARILAGDGSGVTLTSSRIVGGTLGSPAGGSGLTNLSTATLDGVTVSRQLTVDAGGALVTSGLTLSNNALLTVNPSGSYNNTRLRVSASPTLIGGGGTIHLNASSSDGATTAGTADINCEPDASMTIGGGVTVDGFGRISSCPTVNNGVVDANTPGRTLRIESATHQNNNAYRASAGATLDLASTTVTQAGAASILAGDGSSVVVNASSVTGGRLNSTGSGHYYGYNNCVLNNLWLAAPLDVMANHAVRLSGGVVNDGTILVNPSGSYAGTQLRADAPNTAVTGGGRIVLNKSTSDGSTTAGTADMTATAAGNSWLIGPGQTVAGSGRITAPVQLDGVLSPGVNAGDVSFIRLESGSTLTMGNTGQVVIDRNGGSYDTVQAVGPMVVNGTLRIVSTSDVPAGTTMDVIVGPSISGEFDQVVSVGLAAPKRWAARYDVAGRVRVTVLCGPADIAGVGADGNGDGVLDNNDFIVFIQRFFDNDARADYGSTGGIIGPDGVFDNNDFVAFIDLFFAGCF